MLKAIFEHDVEELASKKTHWQGLNKPQEEILEIIMNSQTKNHTKEAFPTSSQRENRTF